MVRISHFGVRLTLSIATGTYPNGTLAVELYDGHEPYATLSVAVRGVALEAGEFVAKTYSANEGLLEALVKAGAVSVTRTVHHDGLGVLPVCRLIP